MVFGVSFVNLDFEENQKKSVITSVEQVWQMIYSIPSTILKPPLNSSLYLNNDLFLFFKYICDFRDVTCTFRDKTQNSSRISAKLSQKCVTRNFRE